MFERLIGNESIKDHLSRVLTKGQLGNSLLFAGPEGIGKGLFAQEFGNEVLCLDDPLGKHRLRLEKGAHPDLHVYKPEGKTGMHSIDAMRQFNIEVYMPPMEAKKKVFIILDAERMLPYSANALLKTFEEPSLDCLIILVSSRPSSLLTTILSRCRKLYFHALSEGHIMQILQAEGVDAEKAQMIAPIAQGSVSQALRLLQPEFADRRAKLLQALGRGRMQDYAELSKFAQEIAKEIEATSEGAASALREQFKKAFSEKLTAIQQQAIDKEVDGAIAMRERAEAQSIFEVILSWYRDLEVLAAGEGCSRLINREYAEDLVQSRQKGSSIDLSKAFNAIGDIQISLERSTGLAICLENLFLKLNLL